MDEKHVGLVPYEVERLERIKRNRQVLKDLGLLNEQPQQLGNNARGSAGQPQGSKRSRATAAAQQQQQQLTGGGGEEVHAPARRSRRLEGLQVEHAPSDAVPEPSARPRTALPVQPSGRDVEAEDYNALNSYRLATMSEEALRRRVWKIRKPNKLVSFIQVLRESGHEGLAEEAEEALQRLGGGTH